MQYGTSTEERSNAAPKTRRLRVVTTALRKAKLAGYGLEEITAPDANQQGRSEQDYGVKASEVAPGPIDALPDV